MDTYTCVEIDWKCVHQNSGRASRKMSSPFLLPLCVIIPNTSTVDR